MFLSVFLFGFLRYCSTLECSF